MSYFDEELEDDDYLSEPEEELEELQIDDSGHVTDRRSRFDEEEEYVDDEISDEDEGDE